MNASEQFHTVEANALHERFPDGTPVYVDTIDPSYEHGRPRRYRGKAIVTRTVEDIEPNSDGDGESGPMPPSISVCLEVRPVTGEPELDVPWYVNPDDGYDTVEKIDA